MAKTGRYFHGSVVVDDVAAVGTSYDLSKYHLHDLIPPVSYAGSNPDNRFPTARKQYFGSMVEGLTIQVTSIAGGATSITVRICADAEGDVTLMPDTAASLTSTGLTTATSACVTYSIQIPFFGVVNQDSKFYVFAKTDAGTVTLAKSVLTWSE